MVGSAAPGSGARLARAPSPIGAMVLLLALLWGTTSCGSATDGGPAVAAVVVTVPPTELVVGETEQLGVRLEDAGGNVLSGRAVRWTSSNDAVATVSSIGIVSAMTTGPVTITATSEGKSGIALLTVRARVASLTIDPPAHTMPVGATVQLAAKLRDAAGGAVQGRTLAWQSSNNAVASVTAGGIVTARGDGAPATITATVDGHSASSTITIGNPCTATRPIAYGQSGAGGLALGDCRLRDGSLADRWLLTVSATSTIQLTLRSNAFDAFLILTTTADSIIAFDNNAAGGSDAMIKRSLAPGSYVIWANSVEPGATGPYVLTASSASVDGCAIVGAVSLEQSVSGSLATTDCRLADGSYADGWTLTLGSSTGLVVDLASTQFDAFLIIADAAGSVVAYDDDGGPLTSSRIEASLPAGTYRVWANSFYPGQTGSYTLTLRADACRTAPAISLGETVAGSLAASDCRLTDGSHADRWTLALAGATSVRIDLTSEAFDPYLLLTDPAGNVVASDDDAGEGPNARIEAALAAGTYILWANSFGPNETGTYALAAAAGTDALNLRVDGLYVTQAIQRFAGTVPLVQGQPALVRVFGRATSPNTVAPPVRVQVFHGTALVSAMTVAATAAPVPTALNEGVRDRSWNVVIDGSLVQPGLAVSAEIDPDGAVVESDESDNRYPADGTSKAIAVRPASRFDLTLVPVVQSVNGLAGDVNAGNAGAYVDLVRRLFPLNGTDVVVRSPYTTTLPALQAGDGNGSWGRLLGELDVLRIAEGGSRTYYGVVKVGYTTGVAGLGYLGRPTAMGFDLASSVGLVTAHELGHTFGRLHAPCGNPGGPDPSYPYADGAIGRFGYDRSTGAIIARTAPDIMSYCTNPWISDYTYEGVLAFRQVASPPALAARAARPVLLVWGAVDAGSVILEPAFQMVAEPSLPDGSGPWSLVARDADERVLFSYSFDVDVVEDAPRPSAAFAFALPVDSALAGRIRSLRVDGPAGAARIEAGAGAAAAAKSPVTVGERIGGRLTMTWDGAKFPAGLLRDARSGRILSIVRGGRLTAAYGGADLELLLSDGVRTIHQRIDDR